MADPYSPDQHRGGAPSSTAGDSHHDAVVGAGGALGRAALDPATRASQAALLGPRRPRPHKIWKKKFIKVLIVGDSGLGKTTLVKTLLSTPGERLNVHDGSCTPTQQFVRDPDSLCSTVTWKDEDDRVVWVYRVQDTPGYGDDLDILKHVKMVAGYIDAMNRRWLALESAHERTMDLSEADDPRVDACLFCLPPHRVRNVDLRYMYELGRYVPIIPIVTKADTMTIREAAAYKQDVFNRLQHPAAPGIPHRARINTFSFDKDALMRAGLLDTAARGGGPGGAGAGGFGAASFGAGAVSPPFLVIASNDVNEAMGSEEPPVFWPERRYTWGTAEAFNAEHSDLLALRALLLKEGLEELAKDKRARYEIWRKHALGGPRLARKLRGFVASTLLPVAAALWFAKNGFDGERCREQLRGAARRLRRRNGDGGGSGAAAAPPAPVVVEAPPAPAKRGWW